MRKIAYIVIGVFMILMNGQVSANSKGKSLKKNQDYLIKIETSKGTMYAVLYPETPKHRANFMTLIKSHYYDDLLFHRVIQDFMIQGGDPESKDASKSANLGTGGPGYTVPAEIGKYHFKGTLAAARIGGPSNPKKESSGSQYYITQGKTYDSLTLDMMLNQKKRNQMNLLFNDYAMKPENSEFMKQMRGFQQRGEQEKVDSIYTTIEPLLEEEYLKSGGVSYSSKDIDKYAAIGGVPFLDGDYTVFGEVVKGFEVIDAIASVKKNQMDRPNKNVTMKITFEVLSKKEITKRTGYQYK